VETLKRAGYTVKDGCQALGISRSGYYAAREPKGRLENVSELRDTRFLEKIKAIKLERPFWGYRRV